MLEPSIDNLQEKINSKYTLVTISSKRARELQNEHPSVLEHPKSATFVGVALEEIDAGKLFVKEAEEA